jgi:capsular polysaccharide biosynthesis protein
MDGVWDCSEVYVMTLFLMGLMVGVVVGYGMGLFADKWDKRIKNDRG